MKFLNYNASVQHNSIHEKIIEHIDAGIIYTCDREC